MKGKLLFWFEKGHFVITENNLSRYLEFEKKYLKSFIFLYVRFAVLKKHKEILNNLLVLRFAKCLDKIKKIIHVNN